MSVGGAKAPAPRLDPRQAVATFFRDDPDRILAVAAHLRGADRVLESTVEGMSMGRTLPPGSRIRIALAPPRAYHVGEVIAFVAGGQVVVHRVVHRGRARGGRGYLLTRGDAPLAPDEPVAEDAILGVVTGVDRDGQWVPPGPRPWQTQRARLARRLLLLLVAGGLWISPRVAQGLALALRRSEGAARAVRTRRRLGGSRGSAPTRAA
jgi:hypothetical protein